MPPDIRSPAKPSSPAHGITFFGGAFSTLPSNEAEGVSAGRLVDMVAPEDGPLVFADKTAAPYFVPCILAVAPYVSKTAERFPGQSGKQRSASHVTPASWFAFDLDDVTPEQWAGIVAGLEGAGVTFCAYNTHSHGEKPDEVRARVLLFMDRTLPPMQWADVWRVVNGLLFGGLADGQTSKLSQQAGVWVADPDRCASAFRVFRAGALMSADALLALVPPKPARGTYQARVVPQGGQAERYIAALAQVTPDTYGVWMTGLCGLKGGVMTGALTDEEGEALFLEWSDSADDDAKANNHDSRYEPAAMWANWEPSAAPADALVGKLFQLARDAAKNRVRYDLRGGGRLSPAGERAALYLARYHRRTFDDLNNLTETPEVAT